MKHTARMLLFTLIVTLLFSSCGTESAESGQPENENPPDSGQVRIVTSFYPMYVTLLNIADGIEGVSVTNMTDTQAGCLHDYSLTTADMKKIEDTDVLVINGAGMEPFMDKIVQNSPDLKVIDASEGITLLNEDGEDNPHVWLSVTNMRKQVETITKKLCEYFPEHAQAFEKNRAVYDEKLAGLDEKIRTELAPYAGKKIVTFHQAFSYFAQDYGLVVAAVISHDSHSAPSPNELTEVIELIEADGIKALFTEPQYSDNAAQTIADATGAKIYTLDPIVTGAVGSTSKNAYITTMEANLETLKTALAE